MPLEPPRTYMPPTTPTHKRRPRRKPGLLGRRETPRASRPPRPPNPKEVRRTRRRVLFFLYALLGIELIAAAFTSPLLSIRRIRVAGMTALPAAEQKITLQVASLSPGTNWLLTPTGRMTQELGALPWVRTVAVKRVLPNGAQVILSAREPCALAQAGGEIYEVDAEGVPIRRVRPENLGRLPLVTLARARPLQPGLPLADPALHEGLGILESCAEEKGVRIGKIAVDQSDNMCLNMSDGLKIQLGPLEELSAKIELIHRIYTQEPNVAGRLASLDLSCPSAPVCTLRAPPPVPETESATR